MRIKRLKLLFIFINLVFSSINTNLENTSGINTSGINTDSWLTVFIHGIVKPPFSFGDIYNITQDCIENTHYLYTVKYLRDSPEFSTFQPTQDLGLQKINILNKLPGNASGAIAEIFDYQFQNKSNHYYTFGWSGLLSRSQREKDAKDLLEGLKNELEKLKAINIAPKIRLIGYSHGGNIILNIAKHVPTQNLPFIIDEAIFLATPVQKETDYLINHPIFKKIYNFYSTSDIAQRADKFSTQYFFSHRKFGRQCLNVPNKLTQIQIRTTKAVFNLCNYIKRRCHIDPQHSEMWTFGWAPKSYRAKFPLYPLPVISLVPTIIKNINELPAWSKDLIVDVKPEEELISITYNHESCCKPKIKYDIPTDNFFADIKSMALEYKSTSYTREDNRQLVKAAMINAIYERENYCKKLKKQRLEKLYEN